MKKQKTGNTEVWRRNNLLMHWVRETEKSKLTLRFLVLSVTSSVITELRKPVPLGICLCIEGEGNGAGGRRLSFDMSV